MMELEFHQIETRYEGLRIRDAARQARLTASMAEHGQLSEVLVVEGEGGFYVLLDGYRRVEALRRLGKDTVRAMVLSMGEREALTYLYRLEGGGRRSALEDGWMIRELCERHGVSQEQLAVQLQRSASWVSRRLALVHVLPEKTQELVRRGKICAYAAGKYLVPLARANPEHCERLVEGIKDRHLGVRQIAVLYEAWRESGKRRREKIVERPALFLRASEETARRDPGDPSLERTIEALGGFCRALRRRIGQTMRTQGRDGFDERARKAWRDTLMDMRALSLAAGEALDAGQGDERGDPAPGAGGTRYQAHRQGPQGIAPGGPRGAAKWKQPGAADQAGAEGAAASGRDPAAFHAL
jgi:ParB family chromosome partitioning protein